MMLRAPFLLMLCLPLAMPAAAAPKNAPLPNPDLTKGEPIPEQATHEWTLGATGARGWLYTTSMVTSAASRQIAITAVDRGSPADGVLEVGDVILGVDGKPFDDDARVMFAKALTRAEAADGRLRLLRWRKGKATEVVVPMAVLGAYSPTAPFNCPKSALILERGCEALAERILAPGYKAGAIPRSLNGLALLASGNDRYLPAVRKEAEWARDYHAKGMATWSYGYVIMFLAEYVMVTGDDAAMTGLERLALEAAEGQSIVGSWGHGFAKEDGRLGGYGMMNAPGVPLTTGLVMAREAGVRHPKVDLAIERSAKLLRFYIGKGAVPYGDHRPWTQTHEDNGKCSMAAVLFNHLGEPRGAKYFSKMALAAHGHEREYGHTGNYWNMTWAMPAVAQLGPQATGAWMEEFGAWYYDLARRWDYRFPHQGPAQPGKDKTAGWDATGAYLLAYAMPLKKILLTGRRPAAIDPFTAAQAREVIALGRGWRRDDRNSAYDQLDVEVLMEGLGSWSPTVRERSAMALDRRGGVPVASFIRMLGSPKLEERIGACEALSHMGEEAAEAVPALIGALDADDLWLRVKAAEALGGVGEPGMVALPTLLKMIAKGPTDEDPRAMEQRFLVKVVFELMLKKTVDPADPELLRAAIVAGLKNQDGRTRGVVGRVYRLMDYDQLKPLLPAIHEAVVVPAPSGIMFADGVRIAGLQTMAKYEIKEGMQSAMDLMEITRWNKKHRIAACLDVIEAYGDAAKPLAGQLRQLAEDLQAHREKKMLAEHAERAAALAAKLGKAR